MQYIGIVLRSIYIRTNKNCFLYMQNNLVNKARELIRNDNFLEFQKLYESLPNQRDLDYSVNYPYIFQRVFLMCCSYGKKNFIEFMLAVYQKLDDFDKIGLRHTLTYGKYILPKSNPNLRLWYEKTSKKAVNPL